MTSTTRTDTSTGPVNDVDNRIALRPDKPSLGKIAILTTDQVEDIEFFYPYYRFVEEGYDVDVLTPTGGELTGYKGLRLKTTQRLDQAHPEDYILLFIPGGLAPAALRKDENAVAFVQAFAQTGNLIGAVCHGPQLLITAGLVQGRTMTSWREVAPEVRAAGGTYLDEPVVEDAQFITARKPGDLSMELARILERLRAA